MVEWIENQVIRIRQYFCKHRYRKHYDQHLGVYINRCVKCGKRVTREPPNRIKSERCCK